MAASTSANSAITTPKEITAGIAAAINGDITPNIPVTTVIVRRSVDNAIAYGIASWTFILARIPRETASSATTNPISTAVATTSLEI